MRFDTLTTHACLPCVSADMEITFTPKAGSKLSAPSVVFIHCEDDEADVFYTVDGSVPTAGSTPYMGKIVLMEGDTLKAIAIRGDCSSAVTAAEYTYLNSTDSGFLEFQFICDGANDKAGGRFEFAANGTANDHHWRIKFTHPQAWFLHAMEIYETDQDGVWITGQGWSTAEEVFPPEFSPDAVELYPIVLFNGGLQLNNAYADELGLAFAPATQIQFEGYGQPSFPVTGYFRLAFTFQIAGSDPVTIQRIISHECAPGSEDLVDDTTECGLNGVSGVTSFGVNGDGVDILVGSFFAGMSVLIGDENFSLTHLGRWIFAGNDQEHVLRVYNSDMEIVGTVTIDANGATPGQFLYGELASPITLMAGATYHIVSEETVGGDEWSTFTGTVVQPHANLTVPNAFYFDSEAHVEGAENNSYGPVGFKYCVTACVPSNVVTGMSLGEVAVPQVTGAHGFKFTVNEEITVTHLGRWIVAGNDQEHELAIYSAPLATQLAFVVIDADGATAAAFKYGALDAALVLPPGDYWLTSEEVEDGDEFYSGVSGETTIETISQVTVLGSDRAFTTFLAEAGLTYGPLDMKICTPEE